MFTLITKSRLDQTKLLQKLLILFLKDIMKAKAEKYKKQHTHYNIEFSKSYKELLEITFRLKRKRSQKLKEITPPQKKKTFGTIAVVILRVTPVL